MTNSITEEENVPVYIERSLDLPSLLEKKSHFLFGPRQTGKTSLITHSLPGVRLYDLLDSSLYLTLSQNPGRIAQELTADDRVVVIDEIQRLPELLNEVQRLIEQQRIHFLLTGSSARKLRRGGVNLLGGRVRAKSLRALAEENAFKRYICVCLEPRVRSLGPVTVLPFGEFLRALWGGEFAE